MTQRKVASSLVRRPLLAAAVAAGAAVPAPGLAAFDAFLKIDGVEGESTAHKGSIDIQSFSFGVSQAVSKVKHCELTIQKLTDKSSPKLFELASTGQHIPMAEIELVGPGGLANKGGGAFLKLQLEDVLVSSAQESGSTSDGDRPTESISLSYGSIQYTYTLQDQKGAFGAPITVTVPCMLQKADQKSDQ